MDVAKKPFNLLKWYTALSFICIVLMSAVVGLLLSRFLTETLLHRDALVTKAFVQSLVEKEHAGALFEEEYSEKRELSFSMLFRRLSTMPEVERSNLYDKEGTVLWSDDERLIGHNFMPNPELIDALSGKLSVSSGISGKPVKGEHILDQKVPFYAEIYIPIWNENRTRIVGAFEVYKTPLSLFIAIEKGQRLVWISTELGGLFIFVSLLWIVRRAAKVIVQQQAQLVEAETMVVIGEMSSAVAHAIRNPLASIRSSAEFSLGEKNLDVIQGTARDIIIEADRLSSWTKEMLAYARPAYEKLRPMQINDVIQTSLDIIAHKLKKQGILVKCDLEIPLPKISGDAGPLRHLLTCLLTNAMEAMPDGGELYIKNRFIEDQGFIKMEITDTGKGIPKEQLKQVFEPFFTTKRTGTGVGLPLVKRIISRHRGTIDLDSTEGNGTTISFTIPVIK